MARVMLLSSGRVQVGVNDQSGQIEVSVDGGATWKSAEVGDLLTTDLVAHLVSYLGFVNKDYSGDNGTRIYILPKASVLAGVGGVLKIFGDAYHKDGVNYRDLGVYFSADQAGDKGSNDSGAFWINGKVNGSFDGDNPDIGFSFQDGAKVAARFALVNNRPALIIGPNKGKYHGNYAVVGLELQKDAVIYKDTMLRFEDGADTIANGFRYNTATGAFEYLQDGSTVFSYTPATGKFSHSNSSVTFAKGSMINNAAIFNVALLNVLAVGNTQATTITNFTAGETGQELTVVFTTGNTTIQHNANIKLAGGVDFAATNNDTLTLMHVDGVWYEKCRSVNG
jgi:hypothetical protein